VLAPAFCHSEGMYFLAADQGCSASGPLMKLRKTAAGQRPSFVEDLSLAALRLKPEGNNSCPNERKPSGSP
jgi:hypothetical protein